MRNVFLSALILSCAFAAAQTLSPEVKEFVKVNSPLVALEHVRVIDGTGAPAHEDQTVIVANGKIKSISDARSADVPKDAQVLDLPGHSIIPGLVGMHDHLFYPMGDGVFGEMAYFSQHRTRNATIRVISPQAVILKFDLSPADLGSLGFSSLRRCLARQTVSRFRDASMVAA